LRSLRCGPSSPIAANGTARVRPFRANRRGRSLAPPMLAALTPTHPTRGDHFIPSARDYARPSWFPAAPAARARAPRSFFLFSFLFPPRQPETGYWWQGDNARPRPLPASAALGGGPTRAPCRGGPCGCCGPAGPPRRCAPAPAAAFHAHDPASALDPGPDPPSPERRACCTGLRPRQTPTYQKQCPERAPAGIYNGHQPPRPKNHDEAPDLDFSPARPTPGPPER